MGIVQDFNHESLHKAVSPLSFRLSPYLRYFVLRVSAENIPQTVAELQTRWQALVPHRPFLFGFLDRSFDALYRTEDQFGHLFGLFAVLAILVACLGLFGLSAYAAEQRTKEIGVRKVLGASVAGLVGLLTKDAARLVGIAFLVGVPLAYFLMHRWLENFSYRVGLGPGVFLLAGALALVIALLTVGYQSLKAATADPVRTLRYE